MKKLIAFLAALAMILALCACGAGGAEAPTVSEQAKSAPAPTAPADPFAETSPTEAPEPTPLPDSIEVLSYMEAVLTTDYGEGYISTRMLTYYENGTLKSDETTNRSTVDRYDNHTYVAYDEAGHLRRETAEIDSPYDGEVKTEYVYDEYGAELSCKYYLNGSAVMDYEWDYVYDDSGRAVSGTNASGDRIVNTYGDNGYLDTETITTSYGDVTVVSYNEQRFPLTQSEGGMFETVTEYDERNNVTSVSLVNTGENAVQAVITYSYEFDDHGNILKQVEKADDGTVRTTEYAYTTLEYMTITLS